jgi:hypothetical protein
MLLQDPVERCPIVKVTGTVNNRTQIAVFTGLPTRLKRKPVRAYLKANGERSSVKRPLPSRARRCLPQIEEDLTLLQRPVEVYDRDGTN